MDVKDLQYVVGKVEADKPATIRLFGAICDASAQRFNEEFLYLENEVKPSKIAVLINSEGGGVIAGMSIFSVIQASEVETCGVIEGIAASMGSVVWAACDKLYMHDYSLLMVHNPFMQCGGDAKDDANQKCIMEAFKSQLSTVYQRRFGMKREDVEAMMNGAEGIDGTIMSCKEAVKCGILAKENVIKTSRKVCAAIKAKTEGVEAVADIRSAVTEVVDSEQLIEKTLSIIEQNYMDKNKTNIQMEQETVNVLYDAVAAQLGFPSGTPAASVSNRITELINAQAELKDVKSKFDALQIQFKGKETEVSNLNEKLADVEAKLKGYQEAEAAAKKAEREAFVQAAIDANKIPEESKASWVAMAETDFDTVKATLASIPAREVISDMIASDPANVEDAKDAVKSVEALMDEKVKAVLGENFELKTFKVD